MAGLLYKAALVACFYLRNTAGYRFEQELTH